MFRHFLPHLIGVGVIIINDVSGGSVAHVGIELTFGLVVLSMSCAVGDISGTHLNPGAGSFKRKQWVLLNCLKKSLFDAIVAAASSRVVQF